MLSRARVIKEGDSALFKMPFFDEHPAYGKREKDRSGFSEQRITEIEREAYESGFMAGERAGMEMGEQKAAILLDGLETIISGMKSLKEQFIGDLEPQLADLAIAIARKIVMEELSVRPELIAGIVKEAMKKIDRTGKVTIRINPGLHGLFLKLKPELTELHPDIVFEVDPSVAVTGPLVIGEKEEVVTDIDVQLSNIRENLEAGGGSR